MDYTFDFVVDSGGYRVELKNEFDRIVAWAWNSNLYAAVLETVVWQLRQSPGDVRFVIRALLQQDLKEIENSLLMKALRLEAGEKGEIYLRP